MRISSKHDILNNFGHISQSDHKLKTENRGAAQIKNDNNNLMEWWKLQKIWQQQNKLIDESCSW